MTWESVALADGSPVGVWGFQETSGTTIADSTGTPHNGTLVGSPTALGAVGPGSRRCLDNTNQGAYVDVANTAALQLSGAVNFSLEAIVQGSPPGLFNYIVAMQNNPGTTGYAMDTSNTGAGTTPAMREDIGTGLGAFQRDFTTAVWTTGGPLDPAAFHHIVMVVDNGGAPVGALRYTIYIDGAAFSGPINSGDVTSITAEVTAVLRLLGFSSDSSATFRFKGKCAGIAIYNSALSAGQVSARFAAMGSGTVQNYFVRKSGVDTNSGTTSGAAFATIGAALAVATGGSKIYVGAGTYRESITVGITPTSAVQIIGDTDGAQTGDAGEVRWTAYTVTDVGNGNGSPLDLNSKNFIQCQNIVFQSLGTSPCVANANGHDCSFTDCAFFSLGGSGLVGALPVDTNANLLFDRCYFYGLNSAVSLTLPTSTVADYNSGVTVRNCLALLVGSPAYLVDIASSGANAFKGGGVKVQSATVFGGGLMRTTGTSLSTATPSDVKDSLVHTAQTALSAGASGQITEDGNVLMATTPRTNVTAGTHSVGSFSLGFIPAVGHERIWGSPQFPFGTPHVGGSPVTAWGAFGTAPAVDLQNRLRPSGQSRLLATGTFTSGAATTATNTGATFGVNALAGATVRIISGTGAGQVKMVKSNTKTVLTVFGNWVTNPDNTSTYAIYFGAPAERFQATANTNTTNATTTQASASWTVNMWAGFTALVASGTGAGQSLPISSNTATVLTLVGTWTTPLDTTSVITIIRRTSELVVNPAAGALERHNRGRIETTLTDQGGVCYGLDGFCDQDFDIPVDSGVSVTFNVRCSFTTDHGNTNKPQLELIANGELGIVGATATATGTAGSGTFENLTLTFTPLAKGIARLRFKARGNIADGYASFDTVTIS